MSDEAIGGLYDRLPKGVPVALPQFGVTVTAWPSPGRPVDLTAQTELQRAMLASRVARGACVNRWHDHTTTLLQSGDQIDEPVAMLCWTCGAPAHLDLLMKVYCHDQAPSEGVPSCADMDANWINLCENEE